MGRAAAESSCARFRNRHGGAVGSVSFRLDPIVIAVDTLVMFLCPSYSIVTFSCALDLAIVKSQIWKCQGFRDVSGSAMTSRDQKPDVVFLRGAEPEDLCFTDRRVPCEQRNNSSAERNSGFRRDCGDVALNLNQFELHLPWQYTASRILERQDSLARAATLQECDRLRDPGGILDFLETTMNIDDYLQDMQDHVPAVDVDLDDIDLQKSNTLCKGDKVQRCNVNDTFSSSGEIQGHFVSAALRTKNPELRPLSMKKEIKTEPDTDNNCPSTSSIRASKRLRLNVQSTETFTPTTTARKYILKTPQERNNTSYKVKRQRNNDAVRKSRSKAKQLQLMKEKQLEEALLEISQLKEKLRVVNERLSRCCCRN